MGTVRRPMRWVLLGTLSASLLAAQTAFGQQRQRPGRYEPPYGPTLSPYLEYSRPRVGVLDNYYAFVRPRVQLRAELRTQGQQIDRVRGEVRRTQAEVSQIRESGVAPTGIRSVYMNYSHFYPPSAVAPRR